MHDYSLYKKEKLSIFQKLRLHLLIESSSVYRYWIEIFLQSIIGWIPTIIGISIRSILYRLIFDIQGNVAIQTGCIFKQTKSIHMDNGVFIDHNVYMHSTDYGIVIGENSRIMYNSELHVHNFNDFESGKIHIGKNVVIGPYSIIMGHGGTEIRDNVSIAPRVSILPINHNYNDSTMPIREQGITAKGILIEEDVWVGSGATILDGVRIGKGSVIGSGSVVTKDVPSYSMVLGVPAKVVKSWGKE